MDDGLTPTERAALRWRGADERRTGRQRELERCRGYRVLRGGQRVPMLDTVWRVRSAGETTWWVVAGACGAELPEGAWRYPTRPEAVAAWRSLASRTSSSATWSATASGGGFQ
jgi:hypothetical protein